MGGEKAVTQRHDMTGDLFFEWRADDRGRLSHLSDNFNLLTGLDPESLLGKPRFGRPENADGDTLLPAMLEAARNGVPFRGLPAVLSDGLSGCRVSLIGRASVSGEAGNTVFEGIGFCPDSGQTVHQPGGKAEAAHAVNKTTILDRMRNLARVGYSSVDPASGNVRIVGPMREMLGMTESEISHEGIRSHIFADDLAAYDEARAKAFETAEAATVDLRLGSERSECHHVRLQFEPVLGDDGSVESLFAVHQDITQQKELELEVQNSDRSFRRAQRLGVIGHWTYEPGEKRVYFSEQAQSIYDCVGHDFLTFSEARDRVHPNDRSFFDKMRAQTADGEPGFEAEIRVQRTDGSTAHILVASEFDFDDTGRLKRTFGVLLDVTPRVEAEAARRDAEAVMTDIFENTDSGILVRDLEGRFIRANTRAAIQLGLRIDDILGQTVDGVLAKSDRMEASEKFRDAALRVVATHGSVTYDYTYVPESGAPATEFRVVNFPISGPDGAVRGVASMRYDITEFVQAQSALKNLNESLEQTVRMRTRELRRSEERFRNIASASADWLWELDSELKLAWCSDNFFEQTGRDPQDYIGHPLTSLVTEQERFVDQREAWDAFVSKLESRSPVRGIEIVRTHPSGQRIVRINARPVWSDGNFVGFQGSTTDITELKQAQTQLIESERLASLGGLVAGISHEINTPVGASYTVVTKLTRSLKELDDAYAAQKISQALFSRVLTEMKEGLGIIQRGLERTSDLISHFKQVAVDQTSHKRRTFSLAELSRDIVATMEATVSGQRIEFATEVPEDIELDSYPGPLGQVMINLIQNAILHGLDDIGDRPGKIGILAEMTEAGTLGVLVSDNGKGMSPNVARRVFEPFFTTKLGSGGSGLGMHLVYSIVHTVLGGTVSVASVPGEGTKVSVVIPLAAPENPDKDIAEETG
ncbi:PAS domain S-box protein [Nisaea acidiphila]|uniref:histidine kinase n=1 Tax=Nisaea acidiphila TaxID=1862145 RepID=A0A9J7AUE4_9PROT|nr:PAS domain S-box protein [Nisaea acidiphila]UUX51355.1 PAS domain S-box protein [Nisaea acidiphila]